MYQYILESHLNTIQSVSVDSSKKYHDIKDINKNNDNFKILITYIRNFTKNMDGFQMVLQKATVTSLHSSHGN